MARKKRKGEYVCECSAYKFPHRFGGGRCTGIFLVQNHWSEYWGQSEDCQRCNSLETHTCAVTDGRERETECAIWQEFVDFNEIRLLGRYWKR